ERRHEHCIFSHRDTGDPFSTFSLHDALPIYKFYFKSRYSERRLEPGVSDFTFGNPHEMPIAGLVAAIRERAIPHDKNWYAYKTRDRKSTRLNSSHLGISYAVFCLKKQRVSAR